MKKMDKIELSSISIKLQPYTDDTSCQEDYSNLLHTLRLLRSLCSSSEMNMKILNTDITQDLILILNNLIQSQKEDENILLSIRISIQCLANLVVQNEISQEIIWSKYSIYIKKWINLNDDKARNYLYALYHSIIVGNQNIMDEFIKDKNQVISSVQSSMKGTEFSQFLIEFCIHKKCFNIIYMYLRTNEKIYMIELLDSLIVKEEDIKYLDDIQFMCERFKRISDNLLKTKAELIENVNLEEISSLLKLLSHISSINKFRIYLQNDKSLAISCMFLLIGMHSARKETNYKNKEAQALEETMKRLKIKEDQTPEFNFKGNLIRIIGNLTYKNKELQNLTRELECIPVILECCTIDPNNPFIREWSIFAIKCITEGNLENQEYVAGVKSFASTDVKQLPCDRTVEFK